MNQAAKAQEPSMEEILASIRRIISDDDSGNKPAPPAPPPVLKTEIPAPPPRPVPPPLSPLPPAAAMPPPPPPLAKAPQEEVDAVFAVAQPAPATFDPPAAPAADSADILDLTEAMAAPEPEGDFRDFRTIDGQSDIVFTDPKPEPDPDPEPEEAQRSGMPEPDMAAHPYPSRFAGAHSLMSPETSAVVDSAFNTLAQTVLVQNGRTLEDLVREMLRPMLKSWLDDNLPGLVERLVRAEIERVSRGR